MVLLLCPHWQYLPFLDDGVCQSFQDMIFHPDSSIPGRCQAIYLYRLAILQATKVPFLNLLFRYIVIEFSHYGLGLSKSFSRTGMTHWVFRFIYFTGLFFYAGSAFTNHALKSFQGMEKTVKGRICLLLSVSGGHPLSSSYF